MNEEEKFDKLLRFKLSEKDYPFDELNWEEAENLIIRQETRRKAVRFTMIFSAGIVAGALIMLPFITNNHNTVSNGIVTHSTTLQNSVAQNNDLSKSSSAQTNSTIVSTTEKAPLPVQPAFVEKDIRTGVGGNSSQPSVIVAKASKQHAISVGAYTNVNRQEPSSRILSQHAEEKQTNQLSGNTTASTITPKEGGTLSNGNTAANSASSPLAYNAAPENAAPPNISEKPGVDNRSNAAADKNSSNTITSNTSSESNKNTPTTTSTNNLISKNDSINNDVLPPLLPGTTPHYIHSDYSKNIFSIYAGGDYSLGWKNQGSAESSNIRQAGGVTPLGGIYYTHYFGNISASLGIGYSELNGLNKTYTSSVTQYDFGNNETVTTVTPQTVYYMAFPLKLQYDIDSKDIVGINCNYLIMLTTYSTLSTYQQTYFGQNSVTSEKQNGYTQGFSNSDWQLGLSYTRMLTGRLGLSAEFYYDLGYIENNTVSALTQSTKNSGFRLVLSYQLLH